MLLLAPSCAAAATRSNAASLAVWRPILPELRRRVRIPIVLPSILPGATVAERPGARASRTASVDLADAGRYEIALGTAGCSGAGACTFGHVSGGEAMPAGIGVRLARGVRGTFTAATCGASCGDATLAWRSHGIVYIVGEKAGTLARLMPSANSAIVAGTAR